MLPTGSALREAAAARFVAAARAALAARGRFSVALAGGTTPLGLYELLGAGPLATRVDWPRVHVFFGDERCVPPDHPASNFRMAREALLDRVPLPREQVHRIRGEDDPEAAAAAYEAEIRAALDPSGQIPRFDLMLLGLGADGHTASLFPGLGAVRERLRLVVAEYVPALRAWRVTATPVLINAAAEVIFLVSGREKAAALRRVLEGPRDPAALPAQSVGPGAGTLRWLVDRAAAAELGECGGGGR